MLCGNCGEEATRGAFFCGGCGRPLGFSGEAEAGAEMPQGLADVPMPEKSRESGPVTATVAKALCGRCMGAYPQSELATVDGVRLCRDCNTLNATRSVRYHPDADESEIGSPRTVCIPDSRPSRSAGGGRRVALVLGLVAAVAGILAVIAFSGSDRIDGLLSGAKESDDVFHLGRTFAPGESFEYGMVLRTKFEMKADDGVTFGQSKSGNMELDFAGLIRIDVLSVDSAGNGLVELSFSGFEAKMRMEQDGREAEQSLDRELEELSSSTVTMTLDPYGKLIGEAETNGPGLAGLMDVSQVFGEGLDGAPRGGLKVGDSWRSRTSVALNPDRNQNMGVDAEYEVLGLKNYRGWPCVVVSVRGKVAGKQGFGAEVDADLKGAMLINRETGTLVKSAMDAEIQVSGSTPRGSIDLQMSMSVDVDLK